MAAFVPFEQRPQGDVLVLFDVDDTLTIPRLPATPEMLTLLQDLRKKVVIGFVGGSNIVKQIEQLSVRGADIFKDFDYCFAENGLTAYKLGKELESQSFIGWLGEDKYKEIVKFVLHYIADLDIPIKRGTFIEFRNGMINISPIGRNATTQERIDFNEYDKIHEVRKKFVAIMQEKFGSYGLTFSIGGMISFDVFPTGWDKTYCLRHVEKENFKEIHFFGDKTAPGGNDYEIFSDSRTIGHTVVGPEDTQKQLKEIFFQ